MYGNWRKLQSFKDLCVGHSVGVDVDLVDRRHRWCREAKKQQSKVELVGGWHERIFVTVRLRLPCYLLFLDFLGVV